MKLSRPNLWTLISYMSMVYRYERSRHAETVKNLRASRAVVDDLLSQMTELNEQVAEGRTKDALIAALKRRVKNVSELYNDKHFKTNRAITSSDVNKITGEYDVR